MYYNMAMVHVIYYKYYNMAPVQKNKPVLIAPDHYNKKTQVNKVICLFNIKVGLNFIDRCDFSYSLIYERSIFFPYTVSDRAHMANTPGALILCLLRMRSV